MTLDALQLNSSGMVLAETIEGELVRLRREVLQGIDEADLLATLRLLRAFEQAAQRIPGVPS